LYINQHTPTVTSNQYYFFDNMLNYETGNNYVMGTDGASGGGGNTFMLGDIPPPPSSSTFSIHLPTPTTQYYAPPAPLHDISGADDMASSSSSSSTTSSSSSLSSLSSYSGSTPQKVKSFSNGTGDDDDENPLPLSSITSYTRTPIRQGGMNGAGGGSASGGGGSSRNNRLTRSAGKRTPHVGGVSSGSGALHRGRNGGENGGGTPSKGDYVPSFLSPASSNKAGIIFIFLFFILFCMNLFSTLIDLQRAGTEPT
jgi:hypothetical protein